MLDITDMMPEGIKANKTKTIFNKALQAIPITQHKKLWDIYIPYIESLSNCHQTKIEIFKRYIKFNVKFR